MVWLQLRLADVEYAFILLLLFSKQALGLECYQCSSSQGEVCPEEVRPQLHEDPDQSEMKPAPCDHVFEAKYCVKTTGMFEGELGTKRFCSSRDWGNYCEWIQRPADEREYRACIFTCTGNNCNHAHFVRAPLPAAVTATALLMLLLPVLACRM